jgi:glycosyltransferase involved in cell wall biosynthesis
LISVGIPTFNRAAQLERAATSVLAQTHANLELVISDNASADGTESLCRALCERDPRVRYLRQPVNRGPTANFNALFESMLGDYAMVLSDDDWLSEDYLAVCLAELQARPTLVLVCGQARYLRDGDTGRDGRELQLDQSAPGERVIAYLREMDENGAFYGLMRRATMLRATPLRNVLGNDWLFTAGVVAQGPIATVRGTHIFREPGGTSSDIPKLLRILGRPLWQARIPHLVIAAELIADICRRSGAYKEISLITRVRLALRAGLTVINWPSLAWHLTMPTFAAIGRRRGGGWLWRAYERLTSALGAGKGP